MPAVAGCILLMCATAVASTIGDGAPAHLVPVPVVPAVAQPVLRDENLGEMERQQRLRELRHQLLEHSRSWRSDAALRRSAAMPEPGDTPAVIADKILPLAPLPGGEGTASAGTASQQGLPLLVPAGAGLLPQAVPQALPHALPQAIPQVLPKPVPAALATPVVPVLPATVQQGSEAIQAAAVPIKADKVTDAASGPDQRLSERERMQLRQQLRQVLRLQEPAGNR